MIWYSVWQTSLMKPYVTELTCCMLLILLKLLVYHKNMKTRIRVCFSSSLQQGQGYEDNILHDLSIMDAILWALYNTENTTGANNQLKRNWSWNIWKSSVCSVHIGDWRAITRQRKWVQIELIFIKCQWEGCWSLVLLWGSSTAFISSTKAIHFFFSQATCYKLKIIYYHMISSDIKPHHLTDATYFSDCHRNKSTQ